MVNLIRHVIYVNVPLIDWGESAGSTDGRRCVAASLLEDETDAEGIGG